MCHPQLYQEQFLHYTHTIICINYHMGTRHLHDICMFDVGAQQTAMVQQSTPCFIYNPN